MLPIGLCEHVQKQLGFEAIFDRRHHCIEIELDEENVRALPDNESDIEIWILTTLSGIIDEYKPAYETRCMRLYYDASKKYEFVIVNNLTSFMFVKGID